MSGNLFGLAPTVAKKTTTPAVGSGWQKLLVGIMIGAASLLAYQRYMPTPAPSGDEQQDKQQDVQPVTSGKTLIFVHERNPQSIEHDLLLREMKAFCQSHSLSGGFRALDDDLQDSPVPQLIQFAQTRGVTPPFVVLTDQDDKPIKAAAWPDIDGLERFTR